MKRAARVGDRGWPGLHAPPTLTLVGSGCRDVEIENKQAWRADIDMHGGGSGCKGPSPPYSHGPEACRLGSLTVSINDQMAVRMGDMLIGVGPPNTISSGAPTVLIGDVPFGLEALIDEY
jgi:uncharacterized Zn-binding protein involved in type VI secretion